MKHKIILIYDFGGQSAHLISRRIQSLGFKAKIVPSNYPLNKDASGIILSGGASSVYDKNAPTFDKNILKSGLPILGICYGHQLIAYLLGGHVKKGDSGEYGPTTLITLKHSLLLNGIKKEIKVWMNHRDIVTKLPKGFEVIAKTEKTAIAAYQNTALKIFSVQFHPEASHTEQGIKIIQNFIGQIKRLDTSNKVGSKELIQGVKDTIQKDRAIIGLSGGVDSAATAILVSRAIGQHLLAVYVDTGCMRAGETEQIKKVFSGFPFKLKIVKAGDIYFKKLKGIIDPEQKRKIIGKTFIDIFNKEAKKFNAKYLVQGTIYSDRIESGSTKYSSKIKSHHNVGGLPKKMRLKICEPLKELYKDEVRILAKELKLPDEISQRKVFPGPGLAIRIIGEVTPLKVNIVQRADVIIQEELGRTKLLKKIWMAFPVLLSIRSVGIQGDERSYKYPIVLRIVESKDAITANFSKIPYSLLELISTRITNEIQEVNRVVYDITNKPPATMEWE